MKQLGEPPGRAQGKRFAIFANCVFAVAQAVSPDLQGAELRDPVLDVVKRVPEKVRLLVPACDSLRIQTRPIHERTLDSPSQLEAFPGTWVGDAPVLVQVD